MKNYGIITCCAILFLVGCSQEEPPPVATPPPVVTQEQMPPEEEKIVIEEKQAQPQETIDQTIEEAKQPAAIEVNDTASDMAVSAEKHSIDAPTREEIISLAKSSGCFACHNIDKKLAGPPWEDVAKRYQGDASAREMLIEKVKTGGKGSWTELTGGMAMPAYSPRVSDADIEKLVDFILLLV